MRVVSLLLVCVGLFQHRIDPRKVIDLFFRIHSIGSIGKCHDFCGSLLHNFRLALRTHFLVMAERSFFFVERFLNGRLIDRIEWGRVKELDHDGRQSALLHGANAPLTDHFEQGKE